MVKSRYLAPKISLPVGGGWGKWSKTWGRVSGRRSLLRTSTHTQKLLPVGGGWVEGGVKTLLLGESTKKKKSSAGGRGDWKEKWRLYYWKEAQKNKIKCRWEGVSGRRSEDFITGREQKKKHWRWEGSEWKEEWRLYYWKEAQKNIIKCRWEGVSGRRSEDFITGREQKKKKTLKVGGEWVEGRVKTLLLEGSTKKKSSAGGRGDWKEKSRLYYWKEAQKNKIKCRWEGVSGRRSEDFITGREHKKNQVPVGGGEWKEKWRLYYWKEAQKKITAGGKGVSGRKSEDFITGREHKKLLVVWGWVEEGETLFPGGSTKINCRCDGGGCEGESVKILAPAGGPKAKI